MKKKSILFLIILIFFSLVSITIYSQFKLHQEPTEYALDIKTDDFIIKNINLVKFNDFIYLSGSYYLESIGYNKDFDGIIINGNVKKKNFLNISMAGDPFKIENQKYSFSNSGSLYKIKVGKNSTLEINIKYKVNGEEKKFAQNYQFNEMIKPFEKTTVED